MCGGEVIESQTAEKRDYILHRDPDYMDASEIRRDNYDGSTYEVIRYNS